MAEIPEGSAAAPVNGTALEVDPSIRAQTSRAARERADRDAFISGAWEAEEPAAPAKKPAEVKSAAKPAPAAADDDADAELDAVAEDADDGDLDEVLDASEDELEDAVDALADEAEKDAGKEDPQLAKRLLQVQRREKRVREQAEAREQKFAAERDSFIAEWKPKIEEAQQFAKLKASRGNIVSTLKALGYPEDSWADLSRVIYGHSKEGLADPRNKDVAARLQRDMDLEDRVAASDARTAALAEKLAKQESSAAQTAEADRYMGRVTKAIGDATPKLKRAIDLQPKSTQIGLTKLAIKLAEQNGGKPVDPRKVVMAYEKKIAAALERAKRLADEEPAAPAKPAAGAKPAAKPAAIKVVDKTTAPAVKPTNGATLLPSRTDMIERLGKLQRGEIDPDAD